MEYGIIDDNGYLTTRHIDVSANNYLQIIEALELEGWKPVDDIDSAKTVADDPSYIIVLIPFDNGDRISFKYLKKFDAQVIDREIEDLKSQLSSSDFKIIKCYEASLVSEDMPYDIYAVRAEREAIREQINNLEAILLNAKRH